MNENHQRHLLAAFRHMDHLLAEAERILGDSEVGRPFAEYAQDSTPVQRKVIHDHIGRVREAMSRAMTELHLPRPEPVCGALRAARSHIAFASIALAEIRPNRMQGYGVLSDADARVMDRIVAELNALLERLAAYLDQEANADPRARLLRLEQTREETRLLRELERIITTHGLVECRGLLRTLLDRLEEPRFEIGVFGRVNSGKSSLLNHLLGAEVLPVGVTPVTAIPTRIRFGPTPRAVIEFADARPIEVELSRLAEFSIEDQNPANAKHVARIEVELPAERLRDGITFVDTPGLGSLAAGGAAEAAACLPHCDLGVVLVDAGSALTHEDLALVEALYQAGARAMLLVSKADLLQAPERERVLAYARQQLAEYLGWETPVYPVSVLGEHARLCEEWYERELKPLLETHTDQANLSLKRKVGTLRAAVMRALETRLRASRPASVASPGLASAQTAAVPVPADAWGQRNEQAGAPPAELQANENAPVAATGPTQLIADLARLRDWQT